ncbi:MAG: mechanosensitive ion channel family protein [Bacteroidota bacterium]
MNDITIQAIKIPYTSYAIWLVAGLLIWLFYRLWRNQIVPFLRARGRLRATYISAALSETLVWTVYGIVGLFLFVAPWPLVGLLLILAISFLLKNTLINFFTGLIIRLTKPFRKGQLIAFEKLAAKVINFEELSVKVEVENGEETFIPYSVLPLKTLTIKNPSDTVQSYSFQLAMKADLPVIEAKNKLTHFIQNLPWSVVTIPPNIKTVSHAGNSYTYRITLYSIDSMYFPQMEGAILKHFSQNLLQGT